MEPGREDDDSLPLIDPYYRDTAQSAGHKRPPTKLSGPVTAALGLGGLLILSVLVLGTVTAFRLFDERASSAFESSDDGRSDSGRQDDVASVGDDDDDDDHAPNGAVPKRTDEKQVDDLTVVDIGFDTPSLSEALREQAKLAAADGERLMVMTVTADCEPCVGVDRSLTDRLMQQALEGIRLVRVDQEVFRDELGRLDLLATSRDGGAIRIVYPGYFLVDEELNIVDAIDGGEWGEDIAANIAPVLGPFVKGAYDIRKNDWRKYQKSKPSPLNHRRRPGIAL